MFQLLPAVGRVIAYAAFFALSMNAHADAGAASWVLSYQNKSTNEFIWDKRTESLVRRTLPPRFSRLVLGALGGPPDPVIVTAGRFASMSACRAHSCIEKGFFWVDSATGDALGGYFLDGSLLLGSNAFTRSSIPAAARKALLDYLGEYRLVPQSVAFVSKGGSRTALPSRPFMPRLAYTGGGGEPSFDCALAAHPVERAICANQELAALDVELDQLVRQLRHGLPTVPAREQLTKLQRDWLQARNRNCSRADETHCIASTYRGQIEALRNWTPK